MTSKIHSVIHVVSLFGMAVLFWFHFSGNGEVKQKKFSETSSETGYIYINSDSLLNGFEWVQDRSQSLAETEKKLQQKLETEVKKLEERFAALQSRADIMTQDELQAAQIEIQQREQQIAQLRDRLSFELERERADLQTELYKRVEKVLAKMSVHGNYKTVFSYAQGGALLYVDSTLDATADVLHVLNKEYHQENKEN